MLSEHTVAFIQDLAANNDREWFDANRDRYIEHYKLAGEAFADCVAARLQEATGTALVPRIFRVFRDIRFSKDKTPFKTNLRIAFRVEDGGGDHPFWMAGLEPERLVVGAGRFGFEKPALETFRQALDAPQGEQLAEELESLKAQGVRISEPDLKRVPAPFPKDHPRADLLRHKGIAVWRDHDGHGDALGEDGPANTVASLLKLKPVYDWLAAISR